MAESLTEFMTKLEAAKPEAFVAPQWYYGPQEDSLTLYLKNEESYARRLDKLVTLFLSFESDELVGCQIKGLRQKLKGDGNFGIAIQRGGELRLGLFFHLLAFEMPETENRNRLVELGQLAKQVTIKSSELVGC